MAFMVPVVKKNYNIYGERPRNMSTSDSTDSNGGNSSRKTSHGSFGSSGSGSSSSGRKRVQSEGSSLCSSPSHNQDIVQRVPIPIQRNNSAHPPLSMSAGTRSFPLGSNGMSRGKGSAPVLMQPPQLLRNNSLPEGPRSACPKSPSRSMSSDSSSPPGDHGFHIKFLNKLKNSFRTRETAPAAT